MPKKLSLVLLSLVLAHSLASNGWADSQATTTVSTKQGLRAEYYRSAGSNFFARLDKITVDDGLTFPDLNPRLAKIGGGSSDHTAVRWTGKTQFPRSEEYTFYIIGDNGFRLWLDGQLAIDHWVEDWDKEQRSAPIRVEANVLHDIKVEYFNGGGGANLHVSWSSPSTPKQPVPASCLSLPDPMYVNSDLQLYLDKAEAVRHAAVVGKEVGNYPRDAVKTFGDAIFKGQALHKRSNATSTEIEKGIAALQNAQTKLAASVVKESFDGKGTGNPIVPGYWADPTVFYDEPSDTFYCFATVDGVDAGWQHDAHVARSKDLLSWEIVQLALPPEWPLLGSHKPYALWAPSIVKNPGNGKYYLSYFIEGNTYIAFADSPMGPWKNATVGTPGHFQLNDAFDAQLFVDTDGKVYLSFAASEFKLAALKFDAEGRVSVDNGNPNMTVGGAFKYKVIHRINVFGEGSALYKKDGIYYLFYAEFGSQNYCVKYATAKSVWGPYTEQPGFVMERDAARDILGPGHVSLFEYGGDTYIGYHRQHFPFVDSKRQTCINRLTFKGDAVSLEVQNHAGLRSGDGALEKRVAAASKHREKDLALGKVAIASSASDFKGGEFGGESFAPISHFYDARFAVDDNLGTRWMADTDQTTPSSLIVDLGADMSIGRTETTFEHVRRLYKYKIEYLRQANTATIATAKDSTVWKPFADRSGNEQKESPLVDNKSVKARYLKITVLSADLPTPDESRSPSRTDYLNRASIVEFRVFAKTAKGR